MCPRPCKTAGAGDTPESVKVDLPGLKDVAPSAITAALARGCVRTRTANSRCDVVSPESLIAADAKIGALRSKGRGVLR